jgi:alkanesulfonate monooxygenase SsuD/methylene tetrahydromethanopterin reductase-like flavin-dependent oxidoreductase (luciferase family)
MPLLTMRQDFRAPAFGTASTAEIYRAALEQMRWADANGFDFLVLSEHHAIDDGWMPAPLTMAGMLLAMTERAPVLLSAAILPLHDPVRVAE